MKRPTTLWLVQGTPKGNFAPKLHEVYTSSLLAENRAAFLRELHPHSNFGVYPCEAFI